MPAVFAQSQQPLLVAQADVSGKLAQVHQAVVDGLSKAYTGQVQAKEISSEADLNRWQQGAAGPVVLLGRGAFRLGRKWSGSFYLAALPITPRHGKGVSLIIEPSVFFAGLKSLAADKTRVYVQYSKANRWLVDTAKQQAEAMGLELIAERVNSLQESARAYSRAINELNSETDAIWLLLDKITANEQSILPQVLSESWSRNFVVFSSKPGLVNRGVLFSYFPDHEYIGKQLAELIVSEDPLKFQLARRGDMVINMRSANHLKLSLDDERLGKVIVVAGGR